MSRATITDINTATVQEREALRSRNGVRLVEPAEEGTSIQKLPPGVYGFTYSPAIAAPLFRAFRYRSFEMHRVAGEAMIVAFATKADADRLRTGTTETELTVFHDRTDEADALVAIPYSRIAYHRQYSIHNTPGLALRVVPA